MSVKVQRGLVRGAPADLATAARSDPGVVKFCLDNVPEGRSGAMVVANLCPVQISEALLFEAVARP